MSRQAQSYIFHIIVERDYQYDFVENINRLELFLNVVVGKVVIFHYSHQSARQTMNL